MNKEQSADPSVDLIRVKNNVCFHFYELPDVVIAYRTRCLWKHSEQLRQRW